MLGGAHFFLQCEGPGWVNISNGRGPQGRHRVHVDGRGRRCIQDWIRLQGAAARGRGGAVQSR